jgi:hypothetical protein
MLSVYYILRGLSIDEIVWLIRFIVSMVLFISFLVFMIGVGDMFGDGRL